MERLRKVKDEAEGNDIVQNGGGPIGGGREGPKRRNYSDSVHIDEGNGPRSSVDAQSGSLPLCSASVRSSL